MCNVAAYMAITALSKGIEYQQEKAYASAQEQALNDAEANSNLQSSVEQQQIDAQASDEMSLRARQALAERARVRVANGEAGIAGATASRLESNVYTQKGWDMSRIEGNRKAKVQQSQQEQRGRRAQYQSERNNIKRPSLISSGLQIAGDYYNVKGIN